MSSGALVWLLLIALTAWATHRNEAVAVIEASDWRMQARMISAFVVRYVVTPLVCPWVVEEVYDTGRFMDARCGSASDS